ncbi:MAG TPA: UDP binding domain-containing protein, partial [Planctomycetota bacterium]|nr:UDP binding domain-containing protein [Planctomycetota bacterium]
ELLEQRGAEVRWHDPSFSKLPSTRHYKHLKAKSTPLTEKALALADAVVIVTDHSAYDYAWITRHARLVVDTRNACPPGAKIVKA